MKVEINMDPKIKEPKIVIHTNEMTEEIFKLSKNLSQKGTNTITAYLDNNIYILDMKEIESFYTEQSKVYIRTVKQDKYFVKYRMYELEDMLEYTQFIRISNSEIINFNEIKKADISIIGTIVLMFKSNNRAYVSRRNIAKIKKYLNI